METTLAMPAATAAQHRPQPTPDALQRVHGIARLVVATTENRPRLVENYQSGAARIRFPRRPPEAPLEAVLINTAGGLTGGDCLDISVSVKTGARLAVTTQASERIYRRSAGHARIDTILTVESEACLDWLPQETIVFDRSALRRTLTAEVHPSARFLAVEAVVLGRAAMGEQAKDVVISDSWRIRRGGKLVFADGLRLDGDATEIMAGGATGNGASAMATLVLVAPNATENLAVARNVSAARQVDAAASARDGVLVCRMVAASGQTLRANLVRLIESLRGAPMPRVWNC